MVTNAQPLSLPIDPVIYDQVTHEEIAAKAYQIFDARGRGHGSDLDDWLLAEQLLRSRSRGHAMTKPAQTSKPLHANVKDVRTTKRA